MTGSNDIAIAILTADQLRSARVEMVSLLKDAVDGGASVNFIAPLDIQIAETYWSKTASELESGQRIVITVAVSNRIAGSVQIALATQPNGLHRAEVQKLLVHRAFRRQGLAKLLLAAAEQSAHNAGRRLLVLDTERGSVAEQVYVKCGYTRAGIIPTYALNSTGTEFIDTVLFYKLLQDK